jgi:hypothetical protein
MLSTQSKRKHIITIKLGRLRILANTQSMPRSTQQIKNIKRPTRSQKQNDDVYIIYEYLY